MKATFGVTEESDRLNDAVSTVAKSVDWDVGDPVEMPYYLQTT